MALPTNQRVILLLPTVAGGSDYREVALTDLGGSTGLTDTQLRATPVDVNLKTALDNLIDSISIAGKRATYYCGGSLTPVATAQTIVELIGVTGKTIKLRRITINIKATAAGNYVLSLNKNSAISTGGTSTTPAIIPASSTLGAASAVVKQFSANPTAPTSLGSIKGGNIQVTNTGTPTFIGQYIWTFGDYDLLPVSLVAATESLSITGQGVAVPSGAVLDYILEWTEE